MRASILIPAFNAAAFITETLGSCLQQGSENIHEIIVVDDHSTDGTTELLQGFAEAHSDITLIVERNPRKGACAARNHALSLAKGEAIQWLDADDLLGDGKLKKQLKLLKQHPDCLIASKWRRFARDLGQMWPEETGAWASVPTYSSPLGWLLADRMMIPAGWLGMRKLFQEIQPWDERLLINQDGEYFTRAVAASQGVIFEPESRVYYRSAIDQSVSHFKPEKAPSLFRAAQSFEKTVFNLAEKSRAAPSDIYTLISNHYQGFIYRVYPLVPELREQAEQKIRQYGRPTRANDVAESAMAKLICRIFGWQFLVHMRILRQRLR